MTIQRFEPLCREMIGPYSFVNFSKALAGLCISFLLSAERCDEHHTTHYSFGISFPNNQCGGGPGGKDFCREMFRLTMLAQKMTATAAVATRNRLQFDREVSRWESIVGLGSG